MTIKQLGGVFGRNPTFNDVTIEGTLTFDGDIDVNSDLKVAGDIETTGNVLVGNNNTDPATNNVNGVAITANGEVIASLNGVAAQFNRRISDGDVAVFKKGGNTKGSIGILSNRLYIGSGDTGIKFSGADNLISPIDASDGTGRDAAIDLGSDSARFKDLYLSGGVDLSDGTTVGSVGFAASVPYFINAQTGGSGLRMATGNIQPSDNTGAKSDDTHDLGSSTGRFKDLYLSGDTFVGEPSTIGAGETGVTVRGLGQIRVGRAGTSSATLVSFNNGNGEVGTITTSGSATAYNTSSDYRLKENVVAITGATARLKQLKPKRFNFIADSDTTVDGFLAHEVAEVIPEAVTGAKDAVDDDGNAVYQGIDQSKLVPLLVATIQELEARIATLEGAN